jgi:hypothetical protein
MLSFSGTFSWMSAPATAFSEPHPPDEYGYAPLLRTALSESAISFASHVFRSICITHKQILFPLPTEPHTIVP